MSTFPIDQNASLSHTVVARQERPGTKREVLHAVYCVVAVGVPR